MSHKVEQKGIIITVHSYLFLSLLFRCKFYINLDFTFLRSMKFFIETLPLVEIWITKSKINIFFILILFCYFSS
jgi:hypothetical protein